MTKWCIRPPSIQNRAGTLRTVRSSTRTLTLCPFRYWSFEESYDLCRWQISHLTGSDRAEESGERREESNTSKGFSTDKSPKESKWKQQGDILMSDSS
jgi:hypothetical protein